MSAVRRVLVWLFLRLVVLPLLVVFLLFALVMALVVEGPAALTWWVDWPGCRKRLRRTAHVALFGWSA